MKEDVQDRAGVVLRVAEALSAGDEHLAATIAATEYPFVPVEKRSRRYAAEQSMRQFLRDGFIDRYSGTRLVSPGALRLISVLLPHEFPAHPNWKMSETHMVFWELFPTIDHVVPVSRGGLDAEENWVTTSMLKNQAKSSWLLDELGWGLLPPGDVRDWDGLTEWFVRFGASNPKMLSCSYIKTWHRASTAAVGAL